MFTQQPNGLLKRTDHSIFGSSVQLLSQLNLLLPIKNKSFCKKGQHAQAKTTFKLGQNIFQSMSAQTSTTQPAIGLKKHNLHGAINQSANHPASFIQSKRRTVFSGDFLTCQDAKWTRTGSHESCVIGVCCLLVMIEGHVI